MIIFTCKPLRYCASYGIIKPIEIGSVTNLSQERV